MIPHRGSAGKASLHQGHRVIIYSGTHVYRTDVTTAPSAALAAAQTFRRNNTPAGCQRRHHQALYSLLFPSPAT